MDRLSYRFGACRVEPASRELWRDGQLVALPPHVFDCLAYLVERHERAVSRDELVAAVWGRTEISDTLLGQTVLRIRRSVGDDARAPQMLRTIPRFGYRWVAPVSVTEAAAGDPAPAQPGAAAEHAGVPARAAALAAPVPDAAPPRRRAAALARGIAAGLLAAALLACAGLLLLRRQAPAPSADPTTPVSAVMPAVVEADADAAWLRLGLMDVVAARLRSAGQPSVPSENVVALLQAPAARRQGGVREALAAPLLVMPRLRQQGTDWQVDLDADDGAGRRFAVQASAREPAAAGRAAADKLLVALGRAPAAANGEGAPAALLLRRIDAAVLADDPDGARALIAQAPAPLQAAPEVGLRLAKIDFRGGRLAAARTRLLALLEQAPAQTEPVLRGSVLNGLGAVAIRADQAEAADAYFGQAVALLEHQSDPAQLGQAYLGRAAAAAERRRFEDAAADYARARIALRQANDTLALIRVAADEGFVDLEQGRAAQALVELDAANEGFQRWGALNEAVLTAIGQIGCHLALLDAQAALAAAEAAEPLAQRLDNADTARSLALAHARALAAAGRLREARDLLDGLRRRGDDPIVVAAAGGVLARLEWENRHAAIAADLAESAVQGLAASTLDGLRADAWLTEVRAALATADAPRAANATSGLEAWAGQGDLGRARIFARLARAEYTRGAGGDWRAAFALAREAAREAPPYEFATVVGSYAEALLAEGDLDAAAVEVGRLSRWAEHDFRCAVLEARLYAALGRDEARQTAVARARALAGERALPPDALAPAIAARAAAR